jgi:hypothetical protein
MSAPLHGRCRTHSIMPADDVALLSSIAWSSMACSHASYPSHTCARLCSLHALLVRACTHRPSSSFHLLPGRHPASGPRDPRSAWFLRLASGDDEGRVMVWNVNTGSSIAALDDPYAAAFDSKQGMRSEGKQCVQGLAWVTSTPSILAVLLSPGLIMLWDCRGK